MIKKIIVAVLFFLGTLGVAFAQVEVNKADETALSGVKGIGKKTAQAIVEERTQNGNFKSWDDFQSRVKGIGGKKAQKLSDNGLTVAGESKTADASDKDIKSSKKSKADAVADDSETKTKKKRSRKKKADEE